MECTACTQTKFRNISEHTGKPLKQVNKMSTRLVKEIDKLSAN